MASVRSIPFTQMNTLEISNRICRSLIHSKLQKLKRGFITIKDEEGTVSFGPKESTLKAEIKVEDMEFYRRVVSGGTLGASEAYMEGLWSSCHLVEVVQIMTLNRTSLNAIESGLAKIKQPLLQLSRLLHRNTKKGAQQNIAAHYDLSNEMFKTFLDPTMMYSGALYTSKDCDLNTAAVAKLDAICQKLNLKPGDQVLEVGTGWGGFARHAAENYGCRVTTTTISKQQHTYAAELFKKHKLTDRINLLFKDYRDLSGSYDKVVAVEAIESIGADFLTTFMKKLSDLLKPTGQLFLQAITINDQEYDRVVKEVDFIKKYIFPGGFLPSVTGITDTATNHTDLTMYQLDDITEHYARTLLDWRKNFFDNIKRVKELGFDQRFIRMWDYYFCYCAGGFLERAIRNVHLVFAKPDYRNT